MSISQAVKESMKNSTIFQTYLNRSQSIRDINSLPIIKNLICNHL